MPWTRHASLVGAALALAIPASSYADTYAHTNHPPAVSLPDSPVAGMIPGILAMTGRADAGAFGLRRADPDRRWPEPEAARPPVAGRLVFGCVVAGDPVEFPDDILISNPYGFAIGPGVEIAYSAPLGNGGTVILPHLAPGQSVLVQDALRSGMAPGIGCSAVQN